MAHWEIERRLDYIDYRLLTAGTVRRGDLTRTFGVSRPQAAKDIRAFKTLYPGAMTYDTKAMWYAAPTPYRSYRGLTPEALKALEDLLSSGHPMGWY